MKEEQEYDQIAEAYRDSKDLSFRTFIEEFTLFQLLGKADSLDVLDLACGEGHYTRKIKLAGARTVLGVDISSEMISLAKDQELLHPIGCEYLCANAAKLHTTFKVDVITGMYLLNYAKTAQELYQFCRSAYQALKPGGIFVGFNDNINENPNDAPSFLKYGFEKTTPALQKEGDVVKYTITNEDGTRFSIDNFFLTPETYQRAFEKAGFIGFSWHGPYLNPKQKGNSFWDDFMNYKPIIGFRAVKPRQ